MPQSHVSDCSSSLIGRIHRHNLNSLIAVSLCSTSIFAIDSANSARAQSTSLVNVCAGLGVTLPHLANSATITTPFSVVNGLNSSLNGLVDGINQNIVTPLSNVTLRVGVLDANGNLISVASPGGCNLSASSMTLDTSKGISFGGGRISGLGSLAATPASAADITAIAVGNGSATTIGSTNAIALGSQALAGGVSAVAIGLRSQSSSTDTLGIGTDANVSANAGVGLGARTTVTVAGGVALGTGAVSSRSGLGGAPEAFSGTAVSSNAGAVSIGVAGTERQITNVAGGTQPTDAVNLRQLSVVGSNLVTSIGGGAKFDQTTGAFTTSSFNVQGSSYSTVGGALNALDLRLSTNTTSIAMTVSDLQFLQNQLAMLPNFVQQDVTTRTLSIGKNTDGSSVSLTGMAGDRRLTGVGTGTGANDAVNLGQLRSAGNTLAASLGGGAGFDPATGAYQAPIYTVAGTTYGSVDRAIGALDNLSVQYVPGSAGSATNVVDFSKGGTLGLVTLRGVSLGSVAAGSTEAVNGGQLYTTNQQLASNAQNISLLQTTLGASSIGLLHQDPVTHTITVGAAASGSMIDVSGTAGPRRVGGVATGVNADDAVNVGQLRAPNKTIVR